MKFFLLRFNKITQFSYTSSVIISLEFVFPWSPPDSRRGFAPSVGPKESSSLRVQCFSWPVSTTGLHRSVVAFCLRFNNGLLRAIGHGRRRLTNRQAFSLGVIDLFSECIEEHLTDSGIVVIHILEEPLLGEPLLRHGLCEGLDVSLPEEVVLGLITCVGDGLVSWPHLLGEVAQGILLLNLGEVEG